MKTSTGPRQTAPAFTLIELLVVIGIIALLASLIFPVLSTIKIKEKRARAQTQEAMIIMAIHRYEADYGRLPCSSVAMNAAASSAEDFTFGGILRTPGGAPYEVAGPSVVTNQYKASNSEIMGILFDMEKYQNGQPTVNVGHVRNPKQYRGYLEAHFVSDTVSPGIGSDGVYRDPWGSPYILTFDFNNDGKTRDAFYRARSVSQIASGQSKGYFGLLNSTDPSGNGDHFECSAPVTVWSAGPDQMINPNDPANAGANKDNVLSWK